MKNIKSKKGITLIALVITIIVLLILAGVSIATLTGENGILKQVENAKSETNKNTALEEVQLEAMGSFDNQGIYKVEIAKTNLKENLKIPEDKIEDKGNGKLKVHYKGYIFNIDMKGKVTVASNIDYSKLKIGDYIDYSPDDVTVSYDKFGETYSGYANDDIGQDDSLGWRILNINKDEETVELISDKSTSSFVYFKGARGYNNGVALLNDYCKTMYSNTSKGAVARSLNIEDIQEKMKVDESTGKKAYENYTNKTGKVYNNTYSYTRYKWYPLQWKNDNGVIGESEPKNPTIADIKEYETEDNAKAEETVGDLTVTQTDWYLSYANLSSNKFESADTRDSRKVDSMYQNLLCGGNLSFYWLASRTVDNDGCAYYSLRKVSAGEVNRAALFYSTNALSDRIR